MGEVVDTRQRLPGGCFGGEVVEYDYIAAEYARSEIGENGGAYCHEENQHPHAFVDRQFARQGTCIWHGCVYVNLTVGRCAHSKVVVGLCRVYVASAQRGTVAGLVGRDEFWRCLTVDRRGYGCAGAVQQIAMYVVD